MKKKHTKVLKDIQDSIPADLRKNIMKPVDKYAFFKEIMQKAIADPEFPEEKKKMYKNMLDSGQMDVIEEEENQEVTKQIDDFINTRIKEEIEKGNLPKYAFKHLFAKSKKMNNKLKTNK